MNQETWDAACARIAELEAENAELRRLHDMHIKDRKDWQATIDRLNSRRCETCSQRDDPESCPVADYYGPGDEEFNEWAHKTPDDFGCNRWTEQGST
ncbi:MAG TPA: hypothetical protein VFH61_04155 [Thermoleophilia bacterium]|nr:hypothetical protein [Thermoleophilia bacterium]